MRLSREIETAIAPATWPEQKAPRLQHILGAILEKRGILSLDFLEEMSVEAARAWLERLPGVGPKTSAAVLCFSRLRRRALPVDSHHHRVAARLGLIPKSLAVGPSHAVLKRVSQKLHPLVGTWPAMSLESVRVGRRTWQAMSLRAGADSMRHALEAMLPAQWDAQQVYDNHEVLMLHGQRVCFFNAPACAKCVLLDLCPTGRERVSEFREGG